MLGAQVGAPSPTTLSLVSRLQTHPPPSKVYIITVQESACTVSEVSGLLKTEEPGSKALPFSVKMKKSLLLHPGPCSTVQLPLSCKQRPLFILLQTIHNVAGAVENRQEG